MRARGWSPRRVAWFTVAGEHMPLAKWYGECRAQAARKLAEAAQLRRAGRRVAARRRVAEAHGWNLASGRYGVGCYQ